MSRTLATSKCPSLTAKWRALLPRESAADQSTPFDNRTLKTKQNLTVLGQFYIKGFLVSHGNVFFWWNSVNLAISDSPFSAAICRAVCPEGLTSSTEAPANKRFRTIISLPFDTASKRGLSLLVSCTKIKNRWLPVLEGFFNLYYRFKNLRRPEFLSGR